MAQTVDPFIPIRRKPQLHALQGQYGQQFLRTSAESAAIPTRAASRPQLGQTSPVKSKLPPANLAHRRPTIDGVIHTSRPVVQPTTPPKPHVHVVKPSPGGLRPDIRRPQLMRKLKSANTAPQPLSLQPAASPQGQPAEARPIAVPQRPLSFVRRMWQHSQLLMLLLGCIVVGLFIQSLVFGELVIVGYAVYALVRGIASRTTFMLAVLSLICVALLFAVKPDSSMTTNFAVYAFLLLVVGTLTLGREIRATDY